MEIIITLVVAALLGLIPASIAKNKGYSFGGWWLYGWLLFLVAFIHSLCLKDKNAQVSNGVGTADELKKYKELLDEGVITREEFEARKKKMLGQ